METWKNFLLFFCVLAEWQGHQVCCGPRVPLLPKNQPGQEPHRCGGDWWQISGWCGKRYFFMLPSLWIKVFGFFFLYCSLNRKHFNHWESWLSKILAILDTFCRWMPVWRHELRKSFYLLLESAARLLPQSLCLLPIRHHLPMSCMLKITPPSIVSETPWNKSSAKVRISAKCLLFACLLNLFSKLRHKYNVNKSSSFWILIWKCSCWSFFWRFLNCESK